MLIRSGAQGHFKRCKIILETKWLHSFRFQKKLHGATFADNSQPGEGIAEDAAEVERQREVLLRCVDCKIKWYYVYKSRISMNPGLAESSIKIKETKI
jgi:hypothetical protein